MTNVCGICKRSLSDPQDPTTQDCGGDCLLCMAVVVEDTDCIRGLGEEAKKLVSDNKTLREGFELVKLFYDDCVDTHATDDELKALVKKYPDGLEALSLRTRLFLRNMGEPV